MADALWSSVAILSHLDETDGTTVNLGSLGGAPGIGTGTNTTDQKFGAACANNFASIFTDGTNAGISTAGIDMSGDFVIEGWIYLTSISSTVNLIGFSDDDGTEFSDYWAAVDTDGAVSLNRDIYDVDTETLQTSYSDASASGVFSTGAYHHVVVQRASGTLALIIDGALILSVSDTRDLSSFFTVLWGSGSADGFVDEVRLTTVSRYTTPFTPPTAEFETSGAGPTLVQGDGSSAGAGTPAAIGATRGALTASSAGTAAPNADAVNKTPKGDGAAAGTSDPQGRIANATQTGGWSQLNYWPPATAWSLSSDSKTATLAPTVLYDEIRGVKSKSSGKWYFEIGTSAVSSKGVGITQAGVALGTGAPPVRHSSGTVSTWGFAFNADTLEYWVRFDGTWNAGGPDALAPPDGTLLPGAQVPYADHSATSGSGQTYVARFTEADLVSAPPAGFTPIDDVPGNVGAAAGTSVATGAGARGAATVAASTGTAIAAAGIVNGRVGVGASTGVATAAADGIPATARAGTATGVATVTGLVRSTAAAQASSAGLSAGTGRMLFEIVGFAAGTAAAAAQAGGRTKFETGPTARSAIARLTATSLPKEIIASTPETALT